MLSDFVKALPQANRTSHYVIARAFACPDALTGSQSNPLFQRGDCVVPRSYIIHIENCCMANRLVNKVEHMFYNNCAARVFVGDPCRFFFRTLTSEDSEEGADIIPAGEASSPRVFVPRGFQKK
jgi:hypothetical protein